MNVRYEMLVLVVLLLALLPVTERVRKLHGSEASYEKARVNLSFIASASAEITGLQEMVYKEKPLPKLSRSVPDDTVSRELYTQRPTADAAAEPNFARVSFAASSLVVSRNGKNLDESGVIRLQPGDHIETCPKHFAVVSFYPTGSLILFPASRVLIRQDGANMSIKSAEFLFESISGESSFPETVRCFDELLYYQRTAGPVSFGMHCRGGSGIILTAKSGNLRWRCHDTPCEIPEGSGLMGRATAANLSSIHSPDKPFITAAIVVPDQKPDTVGTENTQTEKKKRDGYPARLTWNPVPMADQYLVQIFRKSDAGRSYEFVAMHHRNQLTVHLSKAGKYTARVMAFDYLGVSGNWSEPFVFSMGSGSDDEATGNGTDTDSCDTSEQPVEYDVDGS